MQISIRPIGNSQGICIPKSIMEELHWTITEPLDVKVENNALVLKKFSSKTLRQRFEDFYAKPFEEISEADISDGCEFDWGTDVGGEIF